jgi:hypothetical protein
VAAEEVGGTVLIKTGENVKVTYYTTPPPQHYKAKLAIRHLHTSRDKDLKIGIINIVSGSIRNLLHFFE